MNTIDTTSFRPAAAHLTAARLAIACIALLLASSAIAQKKPGKKLYCWNQGGQRICGDNLPPGATDLARTEISASSGRPTGEVARALTAEERAAAAAAAEQAEADAMVEAARQRRDMAMIESYATEADLRRAYNERITLLDGAIKASSMSVANLRNSLVSLLNQASSTELDGKPVPATSLASIRGQHAELLRQQRILARQRNDAAALDGELTQALERYRDLKNPGLPAADAASDEAVAGQVVQTP